MKYSEFEKILSPARMERYLIASENNTRRAMTLYRLNLSLSQEFFTVISCFEITLRNKIDAVCISSLGDNCLRDSVRSGGIFDNEFCFKMQKGIRDAINKLNERCTHNKLVAEFGFGFWRYLFAQYQFNATGKILLKVFPEKPKSSEMKQYNQRYIFNKLMKINNFRNRIAHHEPICFVENEAIKNSEYAMQHYGIILQLFKWMNVNEQALLCGIDHISKVCYKIDNL
ncbi:MAG: Abi family protein [Bacteroidales bacterium]